jgi:hypothetical protein
MLCEDEGLVSQPCDYCGAFFYPGRADHRFCSRHCHYEWHLAEQRAVRAALREYEHE